MTFQTVNVFGDLPPVFQKEVDRPKRKANVPVTSREAHESVKEDKSLMYENITKALEEIKVGATYWEIGVHLNIDPIRIARRLSEMVDAGTVYNVGTTRLTPSGRKSMIRQLSKFK